MTSGLDLRYEFYEVKMEAGRDLDALVAEKVMGWTIFIQPASARHPYIVEDKSDPFLTVFRSESRAARWSPSTDIAAAWEVFMKLSGLEKVALKIVSWGGDEFAVTNLHEDFWEVSHPKNIRPGEIYVAAKTAPLAICLTALKAVGAM